MNTRASLPFVLLLASCGADQKPAPVEASPTPSTTSAPSAARAITPPTTSASPPAASSASATTPPSPPLIARFATLPTTLGDGYCHEQLVAVISGKVSVKPHGTSCKPIDEHRTCPAVLGEGDIAVLQGAQGTSVEDAAKDSRVLVADLTNECPESAMKARPLGQMTIVQAKGRAPLTWAAGAMHAYLDLNATVSPKLYAGRLSGTAKVAEHLHESSWEILADVKGTGTLTLAGSPVRVNPGDVVFIPPNTKHAWTPDDGQELQAVQLYYPPGPEQRFKALAARDDAKAPPQDAGASK